MGATHDGPTRRADVVMVGRMTDGHGPSVGPFALPPVGLTRAAMDGDGARTTAAWLHAALARAGVELGDFDEEIVAEIATDLGPDATQVVAGWVARAATG